jgi:hypothetical protein
MGASSLGHALHLESGCVTPACARPRALNPLQHQRLCGIEVPSCLFSMVSEQVAPNSWHQDAELLGKLTQLLQIAMPVLECKIRATLF